MKRQYNKLSKNALVCMYIVSGIVNVIFAAVIVVLWRMFFSGEQWAMIVAIGLLIICVLELLVAPMIRYRRYRYYVDDECIDVKEGLFFTERNIVPIERLHKIAVNRGPIDNILGLAKVSVTTAGGDVVIRFLDVDVADRVAETLKHRINQIAVQARENA